MQKRIALILGFIACFYVQAQGVETVAAYVNEDIITCFAVQQAMQEEQITYDQALNVLIEKQLLLQDFNNKKGKIPQMQLDLQMANIIQERFNGNRNAFMQVLQMQGKSLTGVQNELRNSIILNVMYQQKAQSKYSISPKEIRSYYNAHRRDFFIPARYYIIQSGFNVDSKIPGTDIKKSDKLQELLGAGTSMSDIEQQLNEFSSEPAWYSSQELDENLVNKLEVLRVGQETSYLLLNNNFVVTKLLQKTPAYTSTLAEVQNIIEEKLLVERNDQYYRAYIQQLRSKAVIKINLP